VLQLVRSDIAGFVGLAERGPLPEDFPGQPFDASKVALRISKWAEFLTHFGGFRQYGYLAYAVKAFFENGGAVCYVVRVAATTCADPAQNAARAAFTLPSGPPVPIGTVAQVAGPFQFGVALTGTTGVSAGDLLLIGGGGVTQLNRATNVLAGGQVQLAAPLPTQIANGASVSGFPAVCTISAASRGNWANDVRIQIAPLGSDAFSLRATVDLGPNTPPTEEEWYQSLTLSDPTLYNYAPAVLAEQSNLIRLDITGPGAINLQAYEALASGTFYLQGGRDGLAAVTLQDFSGSSTDLRGLRLLEEIDEVAIVAVPDAVFQTPDSPVIAPVPADPCLPVPPPPPAATPAADPTSVAKPLSTQDSLQLQSRMLDQCVRLRFRVAVIDPPDGQQIEQIQTWAADSGLVQTPASRYAALYYPWLSVPDALQLDGSLRRVPPSGHVVGAYAQTDLTVGVQKPPANVALDYVSDVVQPISDVQQQLLNLNGVNAIRAFPGRGIRLWGARSLATRAEPDWRFIHVRRLMSAIEATLQRCSRWTVFRSNDNTLRSSLTHSLNVLLEDIWARGGLRGATPAQAFYVTCDNTNNPQAVIDQGQLVCEIGVAIAAPMEFLVFQIRQDAAGSQVLES